MTRRQMLGTCYYPEHWPEDRWPEDARLMAEAGLSLVRIGEFAWSRLESAPGHYTFDWLDRAFDILHNKGLGVVLGTPTATPPKWLVDQMPDMLALDERGQPRGFGSRRHYCFSHPGYREHCARITELLARRYGEHEALFAWQTDNEYGCHDTTLSYSDAALSGFRQWLSQKYQSPDALNRAWGNVFWSMEYRSIDEIELPNLTVTEPNPAHLMDFRRYSSEQVAAFNKVQTDIIRSHSPGRPIGHNFMGSETSFDHYKVSSDLDIATWDSYPLGFLDRDTADEEKKKRYLGVGDPDLQSFHHDLYRTCGRMRNGAEQGRWWVMEQQPGPVNWAPYNPAPLPGATRLWAFEAFAAGAELVSYFRWRQPSFAQEQMHEAMLLPDGTPNEAFHVARTVSEELKDLVATTSVERAEIALVFDYESAWAWDIQPQGADFSALDLVLRYYRALRRAGLNIDVVPPVAESVKDRKLIIVPGLFAVDEDFVDALCEQDGVVLIGPRSGSKTPDFQIHPDLPPGPLKRCIDIRIKRVESRPPFAPLPVEDELGLIEGWREFVDPGQLVETLISGEDGHGLLFASGNNFYLAGRPDPALADHVVRHCAEHAGITVHDLHQDVRLRDNGNLRYVFNYGPEKVDVSDLIGDATLRLGSNPLPSCGVLAFEQ